MTNSSEIKESVKVVEMREQRKSEIQSVNEYKEFEKAKHSTKHLFEQHNLLRSTTKIWSR